MRSLDKNPGYISRINAAAFLDCSVQLIDKWIRQGKIEPIYLGRKVVLRRDQLQRLVESGSLR
jgi:excisionase family DNA binding protein